MLGSCLSLQKSNTGSVEALDDRHHSGTLRSSASVEPCRLNAVVPGPVSLLLLRVFVGIAEQSWWD
eukprot:1393493-Pyramimonas_sp.AAC.1